MDPYSQAAAAYGADRAFGGNSSGDRGREQREKEDRRRQINQTGGLDPMLEQILNVQFDAGSATPEQLIQRYGAVYDARGTDPANFIQQIYGDQDRLNQYAYDTFTQTFGRAPTETEFAQVLPIFGGAEGRQRGAAAVSQMFESYKQSPDYLKTQVGQYTDELDPIFAAIDGSNCPKLPQGIATSHSMLLERGLFRRNRFARNGRVQQLDEVGLVGRRRRGRRRLPLERARARAAARRSRRPRSCRASSRRRARPLSSPRARTSTS